MKSNERRLNLLLLLQTNHNWNVDQLADHFGVSRRTIFRDLKTFSELNVPVTWDQDSGYGVMKGYNIPPLMFSPKEISTIMVGLSFIKTQVDDTLVRDAKSVETKIKSVLPKDDLKKYMDSIGKRTIIDPYKRYGTEKRKGGDWFTIGNAISSYHQIEFKYSRGSDASGKEERVINPYLLVYYTDHWTMIGYDHHREDIRSFRLDRVSNVKMLAESFNKNEIPPEKELLYRSTEDSVEVRIWIKNEAVAQFKSTVPAQYEILEEHKDGIIVTFPFDNLDYLNDWLFTFHNQIKIIAPSELTQKRLLKIQSMLKSIRS